MHHLIVLSILLTSHFSAPFTIAIRDDHANTIILRHYPYSGVNNTHIWCPDGYYVYSYEQVAVGGMGYDESFLYNVKMGCK